MNRRRVILKGLAATGAAAGAAVIERLTRPVGQLADIRPSADRLPVVDNPSGPAVNAGSAPPLVPSKTGGAYAGCKMSPDGKLMDTATGRLHSLPLPVL